MNKFFLLFFLSLLACKTSKNTIDQESAKVEKSKQLSSTAVKNAPEGIDAGTPFQQEPEYVFIDYSQFNELEFNPEEISEAEFQRHLLQDKNNCSLRQYGLKDSSYCDQICETFLVELDNKRKTAAPCDYDQGLLGMSFSKNCDFFVVCSSYDGPDFNNYYEHRAELFIFQTIDTQGLDALLPAARISLDNWSIEDYAWISAERIALKLYSKSISEALDSEFYYCQTALN